MRYGILYLLDTPSNPLSSSDSTLPMVFVFIKISVLVLFHMFIVVTIVISTFVFTLPHKLTTILTLVFFIIFP